MRDKKLVSLVRSLKGPMKPRIMTAEDLYQIMQRAHPGIAISTYYNNVKTLMETGMLMQVKKNLYANMSAAPTISPNEVASYIQKGAVVSLHSALTHAGVINNPSNIVTSVLPTSPRGWRDGKRSENRNKMGDFWFFRMPERMVFLPDVDRSHVLVQSLYYDMATPEKALLDWIYMASHIQAKHGFSSMPPLDIDITEMNKKRLLGMAGLMDIKTEFDEWLDAKKEYDQDINVRSNMNIDLGF